MFCQIFFWWILDFISLWIQGNPSWIQGLLPETNSLVSVPSREHRMCFLQASVALVGIKAMTYPSTIANRGDSDHHNNDGGDDVNNPVLTRAKFLDFHDENQQFRDSSQHTLDQIREALTTLLNRNPNCDNEE